MKRFWMILLLMFALSLAFAPTVQAEQAKAKQEKTKEVKEELVRTAVVNECVVDARNCNLGYDKVMYGTVSFRQVWNGHKFTLQKVCVVKGDKPSVWSFEQQCHAIVSEIPSTPATKEEIAAEEELMEEITGLIIEQTMSRIGYEFHEFFFIRWEAPKGIKDYNIFIDERASPLWGSWIQVKIDTNVVWSKVLKPRSEEIEEAAKKAVKVTKEFLEHYEEFKRELEGPDMMGSGI